MGLGSPGDSLPRARGVQPRARLRPPRKPGRPRRLRGPSRTLLRTRRAPPCVCPVPPGTAASWVPPQRPHEPRGNSRSRGSPREPPSRLGSSRASVGAAPRALKMHVARCPLVPAPPRALRGFAVPQNQARPGAPRTGPPPRSPGPAASSFTRSSRGPRPPGPAPGLRHRPVGRGSALLRPRSRRAHAMSQSVTCSDASVPVPRGLPGAGARSAPGASSAAPILAQERRPSRAGRTEQAPSADAGPRSAACPRESGSGDSRRFPASTLRAPRPQGAHAGFVRRA